VTAWYRPPLLTQLDDAGQVRRRDAFAGAHPGTLFSRPGGMSQACVPQGSGTRTVTREGLRELMDELERIFPAPGG
jgi:hypothetical protein